jgi:hypothetical protein
MISELSKNPILAPSLSTIQSSILSTINFQLQLQLSTHRSGLLEFA